jgi:hypothetical protein
VRLVGSVWYEEGTNFVSSAGVLLDSTLSMSLIFKIVFAVI